MSATKEHFGDKSLATQQIKQQQLNKIRDLLFGCRKDGPKRTQSEYSLASTSKSSQVVDVSSRHLLTSRSDIARLPAGGSLARGCPSIPGPLVLVTESTQTVATQTQETEQKSNADASTPSVATLKKDEATQSSISVSPNPPTTTFWQAEYKNVSKRYQEPARIVREEDEASISENLSQKWSFKRPVIVVNRSLAGLSVKSSDFKGDIKEKKPSRKVAPKDNKAPPKDNKEPPNDNKEPPKDSKPQPKNPSPPDRPISSDYAYEDVRRRSFMVVVPPKDDKQTQTDIQEPKKEVPKEVLKEDKQTQYENQEPPKEKPSEPLACSRIPEILERVCELESKLKNQEQSLKCLQGSMRSLQVQESKPSDCTLLYQAQPRKELRCRPKCVDQSTQKTDEDGAKCRALSKEFVNIFAKPEPCCSTTQNNIPKTISQCPIQNKCEDRIEQFNRMCAQPKSQESSCKRNKCEKPIPSCFAIPTVQCLKEAETEPENLLDKFVELVNTKPKDEESAAPCLAKHNIPRPCSSGQSMQKEVYESMLEQFVKYFKKPKMECQEKQPAAREHYSFERLCAELINLFSKPKNLETCPVKEEDKLKRVSISTTNTILGENQRDNCQESLKKREVKSISDDEDPRKADNSFCEWQSSSNRNADLPVLESSNSNRNSDLPVLESLIDELLYLIGPRPLKDVVLTILRRGSNVYQINVREMATGLVLGSLRANGAAINEAIDLRVFEDIHTFCELDRHRANDPRDCPLGTSLDIVEPQREPGGETQLAGRDASKERALEFTTLVLGLPPGEAGRFFSLTNALKVARKSSDEEMSEVAKKTGLIGRGAVSGNLVFLGSVDDMPVTRLSQADLSELGEASRHFLRIISGLEEDKV